MYLNSPTGDGLKTLTLKISAEEIPARTRHLLTIDLQNVVANETNSPVEFAAITDVAMAPVEGLVVTPASVCEQPEDVARYNIVQRLRLVLENTTEDELSFTDVLLRLTGVPAAPLPSDYEREELDALEGDNDYFTVKDTYGATLDSTDVVADDITWHTDAETLEGHDAAYFLNRANHTSTQSIATVSGLQAALDGKAAASHTHTLSAITDAGTAASLNVPASGNASSGQVVKGNDTRLTDSRTPTAHSHVISDTTGLQAALDGKSAVGTEVPEGGDTGQLLAKASSDDNDVEWIDAPASGLTNEQQAALMAAIVVVDGAIVVVDGHVVFTPLY